jgi:phosphoserine phosphatase
VTEKQLKLAIFDLDGTLKEAPDPYVYLHQRLGTWEASQAFFPQGLSGELDYDDWLRLDAELWKGVSRTTIEALFRENAYLPGARETIAALKNSGVRIALVSTGLLVHARQVQEELGLDSVVANEIFFENGLASGKSQAHVPEGGKGHVVCQLLAQFGVHRDECLAVGDGSSDADMFAHVRLGVAVNPSSDRVREAADIVLDVPDLRPLLALVQETFPTWISS